MSGKIDARAVMKGVIVFVGLMIAYLLLGLLFVTIAKNFGGKDSTLNAVLSLSSRLLWIVSVLVPGVVAGRAAGKNFFVHGALVGMIGGVISVLFDHFWSLATGVPPVATGARPPSGSSFFAPGLLVQLLGTVLLCGIGGMAGERRDTKVTPSPKLPQAEAEAKPTESGEATEEEALHHSGLTLYHQARTKSSEEAKALYQAACEKFSATSAINSNNPKIMNDWGVALMAQAGLEAGEAGEALNEQAREKFLAAEALQPGIASYNLACIHSRRGEYEDCRKCLEAARDHKSLPSLEQIKNDADLANVRQLKWFRKFINTIRAG